MAKNDWILDVLADLKSFAEANDLNPLAAELDNTLKLATSVLSETAQGGVGTGHAGQTRTGSHTGTIGGYRRT
ncbi:MAG: hypothetical protein ACU0BB_16655 [Paracoccaceae bacterium]|jgi:hypothetical protein